MYHRLSYISGGIFVRSDIMYHRLSFVSGGALLFKSSTLYILVERHNEINQATIPPILFSYMQ
jgi:hypothetical protein